MKALIVGLGSMGKRRARLLKTIMPNVQILGVDMSAQRRDEGEALGFAVYSNLGQALAEKPHFAFVCTAPATHFDIIKQLVEGGVNTFTELNLISEGYGDIAALAAQKGVVVFMSSTMLYRGETKYIAGKIKAFDKPVSYIYHIGQYLPDWHPWESYKNFFVADKRTNGCREIFGIEMPWLINTFGKVEKVYANKEKVSGLEIDYPDRYFVTLEHEGGAKGMLAVDVVSPKAVRNFEVFGEGLHLFWEGNPKALYQFDPEIKDKVAVNTYTTFEQDPRYSDNIVENAYVDELLNFFAVLENREKPRWSFEKDLAAIQLIDTIENFDGRNTP